MFITESVINHQIFHFLAELIILRSYVREFVMTRKQYLNGANFISSQFYFLGRDNIKKITHGNPFMLKLVVLDTDGERRIVKFENWALKVDNKVTFRTCISPDLGKQFW